MTLTDKERLDLHCDCALLIGALRNAKRWLHRPRTYASQRMLVAWLVVAVDHASEVSDVIPVDMAPEADLTHGDIGRMIDGCTMHLRAMIVAIGRADWTAQATDVYDARSWAGTVAGMIITSPELWQYGHLPDYWLAEASTASA